MSAKNACIFLMVCEIFFFVGSRDIFHDWWKFMPNALRCEPTFKINSTVFICHRNKQFKEMKMDFEFVLKAFFVFLYLLCCGAVCLEILGTKVFDTEEKFIEIWPHSHLIRNQKNYNFFSEFSTIKWFFTFCRWTYIHKTN